MVLPLGASGGSYIPNSVKLSAMSLPWMHVCDDTL